jgi:hypothetical protein
LKHPKVLPQGVAGHLRKPTNPLMSNAQTLQPQDLHSPPDSRVWMLVTQPLDIFPVLLTELDSDHRRSKVHVGEL